MNVVLVHIGENLPSYLIHCIRQFRYFVSVPIHVLLERKLIETFKSQSASITNLNIFALEDIPKTANHYKFIQQSSLSKGFWRSASERFFYIHEYCLLKNLENVIHTENDILVYYDFTKCLETFLTKPLWAVFDAERRCIPSFMFIRNSSAIEELANFFLSDREANDMLTIAMFREVYPEFIGSLPIIKNYVTDIPKRYTEYADAFGVLFDGAAVGQYIGGIDKIHNSGDTTGFINETTIFQCDKVPVEFRIDNGFKVPYLNGMPLMNLHIHSKELYRWMSI